MASDVARLTAAIAIPCVLAIVHAFVMGLHKTDVHHDISARCEKGWCNTEFLRVRILPVLKLSSAELSWFNMPRAKRFDQDSVLILIVMAFDIHQILLRLHRDHATKS